MNKSTIAFALVRLGFLDALITSEDEGLEVAQDRQKELNRSLDPYWSGYRNGLKVAEARVRNA